MGCNLMGKHLTSMCKALGLIPKKQINNKKTPYTHTETKNWIPTCPLLLRLQGDFRLEFNSLFPTTVNSQTYKVKDAY
jgi:hypothetical protein